jgi:8-oxo-dGTP pyrophosphatase MutT (NUDIX family)
VSQIPPVANLTAVHTDRRLRISGGDFARLASRHLSLDIAELTSRPHHGDHELNPDRLGDQAPTRLTDAAVLFGIVDDPDDAQVILTLRTAHLSSHAGQVAFPGGKIDDADETPTATALREAAEEIGLDANHVQSLGYFTPYHTGSGYRIIPVVGMVRPGYALTPNPIEVADIFEVPLGFLMDPANHRLASRETVFGPRYFYEMPFDQHYIWGVTAGIIRRVYERVYGA